jgi:hypothetical protein
MRNEAEDRTVSRVFVHMEMDELKELGHELRGKVNRFLKKESGYTLKTLKGEMGEIRIVYMAQKFAQALEAGDIKEAEYFGEKIDEYCIQKPKPEAGGESTGADRLMEAVANVIEKKMLSEPEKALNGQNE